jgi:hypothetical protein
MLEGGAEQIFKVNNARVVDQDVDSTELLQRPIGQSNHLLRIAQVSQHVMATAPELSDDLLCGLEANRIAATDHKIRACRCQHGRNLSTKASRSAGNQGTLVMETEAGGGIGHRVDLGDR